MRIEDRFWSKVDQRGPDECWSWLASLTVYGYGQFSVNNRPKRANRLAYELAVGPIPDGLHVCHKCDNPACCNPAHLWLGTAADNALDRARKLRSGRAKISRAQAVSIYHDTRSQRAIARDYGLRQTTVSRIKRREIWVHIHG